MSDYHIPVLLKEALDLLNIQKDSWYIDCNLGGGGHTKGILDRGGKVLGIDLDQEALKEVESKFSEEIATGKLLLSNNNFTHVRQIVIQQNLKNIRGVLFDLGVSSHQLETPDRGFSFNVDADLDMRMDPINQKVKASDLINGLHEKELEELFLKLGEENFAKRISKKIIEKRANKPIETTNELSNIILSVRPRSLHDRTHPATRVFQALRIAVNDELNSLKEALPEALKVLDKGGRLVVISFHSLEDRIVKNYFKEWEKKDLVKILTKRIVEPTEEEVNRNPRARSGKLRVIERI